MAEEFTAKFKVDISDLKKNISDARKEIKLADAAFKAGTAGMDDWKSDAEGLAAKLKQLDSVLKSQKSIVESYRQQLERNEQASEQNGKRADELRAKLQQLAASGVDKASAEYKKYEAELKDAEREQARNEKSVDDLRIKLLNAEAAVGKTEKEIRQYGNALNSTEHEVKDLSAAEKTAQATTTQLTDGFTVMRGALASLAAQGIRKVVDGLKSLITDGAKYADDINTLASKTSLSTDTLQKFSYMSGLVDVEVNTVAKSMQRLTKNMDAAQKGSGSAYDAFKDLGVSFTDVNGNLRDNEDVFYDVIEALGKFENETERDAVAMKLFGKNATELNPMIEAGAEQLAAWSKEAEDMGYVMDKDMIDGLVRLHDSFDRFNAQIQTTKNRIAAGLAPAVEDGTKKLTEMISTVDGKKIGKELGNFLKMAIDGFGWILKHGDLIKASLTGILAAFAAQKVAQVVQGIGNMTKALTAMNAAANANPYVLLTSVLIGLIAGMVSWSKSLGDAYWAETDLGKETERLNEIYSETSMKTQEMVSAYEAMDEARTSAISSAQSEASHLQSLTDELGTLVGANGEVAEADKARAEFILNELNTALGTEYDMNDLLAGSYKELAGSVAELIEQKRIDAILSAQEAGYAEAVSKRADAEATLASTTQTLIDLESQKAAKVAERSKIEDEDYWKMTSNAQGRIEAINKEIAMIDEQTAKFEEDYAAQAETVNKYMYDIDQYEANWESAHNKRYDEINTKSYEVAKASGENVKNYASTVTEKTKEASDAWLRQLSRTITETTGRNVEFRDAGNGMVSAYVDGQKVGEDRPAKQVNAMTVAMLHYMQILDGQMKATAANIPGGIAQGIYDSSGTAFQAVKWLADNLFATFNANMKIKSPSQRMAWSALQMINGLIFEIEDNKGRAENTMKGLADGMTGAFNSELRRNYDLSGLAGAPQAIIASGQQGSYTAGGQPAGVTNNYTQNIFTPKAPSRRDVYRNTKNLLQLARRN